MTQSGHRRTVTVTSSFDAQRTFLSFRPQPLRLGRFDPLRYRSAGRNEL